MPRVITHSLERGSVFIRVIMIDQYNYPILKERVLEQNEIVVFPIPYKDREVSYVTKSSYMCPSDDCHELIENFIFTYLEKEGYFDNVEDYLSSLYGYPCKDVSPHSQIWRDCQEGDYAALSRVVVDIFEKLCCSVEVEKISLTNVKTNFLNNDNR